MIWLKNITFSICIFSLINTLIKILAPNRLYPQIKTVISLLMATAIGSMILGFDISDLYSEFSSIDHSLNLSQEDSLVVSEIESRLNDYITAILDERGYDIKKVEIKTNIDDQYCISISEAWITIRSEYENKTDQIKQIIKEEIGDIDININVSEE